MSSHTGALPLLGLTKVKLLQNLRNDLETETRNSTFACGGSIRIHALEDASPDAAMNDDQAEKSAAAKPVTIRFERNGESHKVVLPCDWNNLSFKTLIDACQPATFGRGKEEVLDPDYRKATKLDTADFCTDFCPYRAGIIDTVTQLLLPGALMEKAEAKSKSAKLKAEIVLKARHRGIRAELYKLNFYSGPSGMFKAHVDTPSSEKQIGSLVVSLPSLFEGGQLTVENKDKHVIFDWSQSSKGSEPMINWAAFYSDCVHEVQEVTSGHRLTLTYNLFVSKGTGLLTGQQLSLDRSSLPLYQSLQATLSLQPFLRNGGLLGFYLAHSYPHTDKNFFHHLPAALKGSDMVLYECVQALGLECQLVPVMKEYHDFYYDDYDSDERYSDTLRYDEDDSDEWREFEYYSDEINWNELGLGSDEEDDEEIYYDDDEPMDEEEKAALEKELAEEKLAREEAKKKREEERAEYLQKRAEWKKRCDAKYARKIAMEEFRDDEAFYAKTFREPYRNDDYFNEPPEASAWADEHLDRNKIIWVTRRHQKEVQMAYMTYGNYPEWAVQYSSAALIVRIPPFDKR